MRGREASRDEGTSTPLRVLVVEDSEYDAMLLVEELRRGGYQPVYERVFSAEEMEEALAGAKARGEDWQIVVSDYYMPHFSGPDALALLRRLGYDTPFIVVSGKIGEEAAVAMMRAGARDYVAKDNMARLCPAIERELREAAGRKARKEAEKRLREAERRFRTLVERIPAITYIQSPGGNKPVGYVSPQLEELLGYSPEEEVIDDDFLFRTVHPEDRERFVAEDRRTDETGEPFRIEYRMTAKDGHIVWIRDEAVLVRDERGDPLYWLGVQYDITDLKRIEENLRESEERYRTFIEQSTEGIWRLEFEEEIPTDLPEDEQIERFYRHGYLAECNDAMARMYGFSRAEEMVGARLVELLPPSVPENGEYLRAAVHSGYRLTSAESQELDREGNRKYFLNNLTGIIEDGRLVRIWGTQRDVTEKRAAEEELRYSEERFRVLAEEVVEGLALNESGKLFDANRSFTEMFGYRFEEVVGMDAAEFVAPEKREEVVRRIATGNTEAYESLGLKKDGAIFPIEVRPRSIPYFGRVVRVTSIIDLTERKRAEEALRASEERFRATFEQAAVGMAHVGLDGRWLRVNGRLCEITGYEREELLGLSFQDITHPDDLERDTEHLRRMLEGEVDTYSTEKRYIRKDDTLVWINLTTSLMREPSGEQPYFISVIEDIGGRKRTEEALRESEERYRAVVEQSTEGIYLVDVRSRRVLETNPAFRQMLGYRGEEIKGMELYELMAHSREDVDYNLQRTLEEERRFVGERRYRRKDGSVVDVEVAASVIRYGEREVVCVVVRDITERKEAERRLTEVREAERNRIARDLHDDILQDIVYALQEIQIVQITTQGGGDEALEDAADALRRSVEGLRGAIFELRVGALSRSFFSSLEALLDLNRRMARNRYEPVLTIENEFPPEISEKAARQLTRVVQEALTNVRRHAEARRVEVRLWREGEAALVEVADDGRGFDAGASGVGVGQQSMIQRVSEIGGELEVDSAPAKGTRVRVRVPISRLVGAEETASPGAQGVQKQDPFG